MLLRDIFQSQAREHSSRKRHN